MTVRTTRRNSTRSARPGGTFKTLAQGAATSVYVASSPLLNGVAGRYFENCQEDTPDDPTVAGTDAAGVAAYRSTPKLRIGSGPCPSR